VSSAKSIFVIKFKFDKSFINDKKNKGPKIKHWGIQEIIEFKDYAAMPPKSSTFSHLYCIKFTISEEVNLLAVSISGVQRGGERGDGPGQPKSEITKI